MSVYQAKICVVDVRTSMGPREFVRETMLNRTEHVKQ